MLLGWDTTIVDVDVAVDVDMVVGVDVVVDGGGCASTLYSASYVQQSILIPSRRTMCSSSSSTGVSYPPWSPPYLVERGGSAVEWMVRCLVCFTQSTTPSCGGHGLLATEATDEVQRLTFDDSDPAGPSRGREKGRFYITRERRSRQGWQDTHRLSLLDGRQAWRTNSLGSSKTASRW